MLPLFHCVSFSILFPPVPIELHGILLEGLGAGLLSDGVVGIETVEVGGSVVSMKKPLLVPSSCLPPG